MRLFTKMGELEKLLWLSCGNKDGLIRISQRMQRYLKDKQVPHVWNVDSHGHDPTHWRNNLHHFAQRLFKDTPAEPPASDAAKSTEDKPLTDDVSADLSETVGTSGMAIILHL